ncbi:signal peptidase I [Clostridium sp. CAG:632]|nr:signal peptidase I [Clostridium sp. CAG:632]
MEELKCSVCGSPVNAGDSFCQNCGNPIQPQKQEETVIPSRKRRLYRNHHNRFRE